jgi:hypothetical protein
LDPGVSLCPHLGTAGAAFTIAPGEILEWHDGPVAAIVRCRACGAPGWIELLDRSPDGAVRVFALAGLRERDAALYLRDAQKGSCDPQRGRAELEALAAAAGPFARLVAWDARAERVIAVAPLERTVPSGGWPARMPAREDTDWFDRLGLDKAAPAARRPPA